MSPCSMEGSCQEAAYSEPDTTTTKAFSLGDIVVINGNLTGMIAYTGCPKGSKGTLAGVHLLGLSMGCGDSDGSYHGVQYFRSEPMNALFVPIDCLSERPTSRMDKIRLQRELLAEQERLKTRKNLSKSRESRESRESEDHQGNEEPQDEERRDPPPEDANVLQLETSERLEEIRALNKKLQEVEASLSDMKKERDDLVEKLNETIANEEGSKAELKEMVSDLMALNSELEKKTKELEQSSIESKTNCDKNAAQIAGLKEEILQKEKSRALLEYQNLQLKKFNDNLKSEQLESQEELQRLREEARALNEPPCSDLQNENHPTPDFETSEAGCEDIEFRSPKDELNSEKHELQRSLAEAKDENSKLEDMVKNLMKSNDELERKLLESLKHMQVANSEAGVAYDEILVEKQELEVSLVNEKRENDLKEERIQDLLHSRDQLKNKLLKSTEEYETSVEVEREAWDILLSEKQELEALLAKEKEESDSKGRQLTFMKQANDRLEHSLLESAKHLQTAAGEARADYIEILSEKQALEVSLSKEKETNAAFAKQVEELEAVSDELERGLLLSTKNMQQSLAAARVDHNNVVAKNHMLRKSLAQEQEYRGKLEEQLENLMVLKEETETSTGVWQASYDELFLEKKNVERSLEEEKEKNANMEKKIADLMTASDSSLAKERETKAKLEKEVSNLMEQNESLGMRMVETGQVCQASYDELFLEKKNVERSLEEEKEKNANMEKKITDLMTASDSSLAEERETKAKLEKEVSDLMELNESLGMRMVEARQRAQASDEKSTKLLDEMLHRKQELERSLAEEKESNVEFQAEVEKLRTLNKKLEESVAQPAWERKGYGDLVSQKQLLERSLQEEKESKAKLQERMSELEVVNKMLETNVVEFEKRLELEMTASVASAPFDERNYVETKPIQQDLQKSNESKKELEEKLQESNESKKALEKKLQEVTALNSMLESSLKKSNQIVLKAVSGTNDSNEEKTKKMESLENDLVEAKSLNKELEDRFATFKQSKKQEVSKLRKLWSQSIDLNDQLRERVLKLEEENKVGLGQLLREKESVIRSLQKSMEETNELNSELKARLEAMSGLQQHGTGGLSDIMHSMKGTARQITTS